MGSLRLRPRPRSLQILALVAVAACVGTPPGSGVAGSRSEAPSGAAPTTSAAPTPVSTTTETRLELVWRVDAGLGQPTGIARRPDGTLLVVDWVSGVIHAIGADGRTVKAWGRTTAGDGGLSHPAGIAVDDTNRVFVADHDNDRIARFNPTGSFELAWGARGSSNGSFQSPDVVEVGAGGLVYVSEDANRRVQVLDQGGSFLRALTKAGDRDFADPTGIALGKDELYVADYGASRIWVFDANGKYLRSIGKPGEGPGELHGLSMIALDPAGDIFATDYEHGLIQVFAPGGEHVATYVLDDGLRFARPWGLAIGPDGDLYVGEFQARRVERLRVPR